MGSNCDSTAFLFVICTSFDKIVDQNHLGEESGLLLGLI